MEAVKTLEKVIWDFLTREKNRKLAAATQIQSYYRTFSALQQVDAMRATKLLRKKEVAAVAIQRCFRQFAARKARRLFNERMALENKAAIVIQAYYRGFYASRIRASIQFFDDDEYNYVEVDESLDTFREFMDSLDEPMRPLTREKEDLDAELQMLLKTVPDVPPFHDSDRIGIITPRLRSGKTGGNSLRRRNSGTVSPALSLETIELETPELPPNLPRGTLRETKNDNFFRHKSRSPFPPSQSQRVAVEDAQSEASGLLSSCPQTPRLADTSAKPVNTLSSKKVTPSPG